MRRKPDISGKRRSTAIRSPTYTQVLEDCSDALPSQPSAMVCLTLPNETLLPPNSFTKCFTENANSYNHWMYEKILSWLLETLGEKQTGTS